MKLTWKRVDLRLAHTWTIARTAGTDVATVVVVELTSADGTIGRGEAAPTARYKESPASVERFLKSVDPRGLSFADVEGSMQYLETLSRDDRSAKCALNLALLDGAGKRANKPVYDLLGLGFREGHHLTSFTIGLDSPEIVHQKVIEAAPFPILKIKVGVPGDRANLAAVREAAPDKLLRLDANEGWKTKEEALANLEWLAADAKIQFVEQPMPAGTPAKAWAWLKERSPIPFFADESYHLADDIDEVKSCFHGVNVKLVKSGGISNGLLALKAARKAGLKTMIGCMIETSILISAAAHLAELCDYLDLDGHILITNDPYAGATARQGQLSFAAAEGASGLRVSPRSPAPAAP